MSDFNDKSTDAMFATIIERFDARDLRASSQHHEVMVQLDALVAQVTKVNGRVRELEAWRSGVSGRIAGIAVVVSGIVVIAGLILQAMLIK